MQLRRLLEPGRGKSAPYEQLVTSPPGYVLRLAPEALDLSRFERLAAAASDALAAGAPQQASELLREALGLWRGPALADPRVRVVRPGVDRSARGGPSGRDRKADRGRASFTTSTR